MIKTHSNCKTLVSTKFHAVRKLVGKMPFVSLWYFNVFHRETIREVLMHSSQTEILSNPKGCVVLAWDVKYTSHTGASCTSPGHTSTNAMISLCHLGLSCCILLVRIKKWNLYRNDVFFCTEKVESRQDCIS